MKKENQQISLLNQQWTSLDKQELGQIKVKPQDLVHSKPIYNHTKELGEESVLNILVIIISNGVNSFSTNSRMNEYQIAEFAQDFLRLNSYESFEDLIYTFQLMRNGYFGELLIIDQAIIMDKFKRVLEIKCDHKEKFMIEESKKYVQIHERTSKGQVLKEYMRIRDEQIEKERIRNSEEYKKKQEEEHKEKTIGKMYEYLHMYASSMSQEELTKTKQQINHLDNQGFDVRDHMALVDKYLE